MAYPPLLSDDEKKMLLALKHRTNANPIEWEQYQAVVNLAPSIFLNGFAHLVTENFVDTARASQGFLRSIFGAPSITYSFITPRGLDYLEKYGHTSASEDRKDAALNETPQDRRNAIEEAVRIYQNSLSTSPFYSSAKISGATARLDEDIKEELRQAVVEEETMWIEFEKTFGHRGPASTTQQAAVRDPVIKRTSVRMFRAMDEQLRRLNLPESRKPEAWSTHYNNGQVGLDPPTWEK